MWSDTFFRYLSVYAMSGSSSHLIFSGEEVGRVEDFSLTSTLYFNVKELSYVFQALTGAPVFERFNKITLGTFNIHVVCKKGAHHAFYHNTRHISKI